MNFMRLTAAHAGPDQIRVTRTTRFSRGTPNSQKMIFREVLRLGELVVDRDDCGIDDAAGLDRVAENLMATSKPAFVFKRMHYQERIPLPVAFTPGAVFILHLRHAGGGLEQLPSSRFEVDMCQRVEGLVNVRRLRPEP